VKHARLAVRALGVLLGAAAASWSALMLWLGLAGGGWRDWWREYNPVYLFLYGVLLMLGVWLIIRALSPRRGQER
jgi:membrane protein DedA with SNARE-associated domain